MATQIRFFKALGLIPVSLKKYILTRGMLVASILSFVSGWAGTWILGYFFKASSNGPPTAAMAASFLFNLSLLAVLWASFPALEEKEQTKGSAQRESTVPWTFTGVWVRFMILCILLFTGMFLSPGRGVNLTTALTFAALTSAQGAVLAGIVSVVDLLAGTFQRVARLVVLLMCALLAGGILWTKPILSELKLRVNQAQMEADGEDVIPLGRRSAKAIWVLGPSTGMASVWWGDGSGLDLIKGPNTYRIWVGSWIIAYPNIWPQQEAVSGSTTLKRWSQGLILALLSWGVLVFFMCDFLKVMRPKA